jgi:hypothetical protein
MNIPTFKRLVPLLVVILLASVTGGAFAKGASDAATTSVPSRPGTTSISPGVESQPPTPQGVVSLSSEPEGLPPPGDRAPDPDAGAARAQGAPAGWIMMFKFVAGVAFHPHDSGDAHTSFLGGCITQVGGSDNGLYAADLQLPDGAQVDILRHFFYDESAVDDSDAYLTEYDGGGSFSSIAYAPSSGASGYGNAADTTFNYAVDNYDHALVLNWRSHHIGPPPDIMLCGMRVRYWVPPYYASFLPSVMR